jgi:CRISP-associated protein Cas1
MGWRILVISTPCRINFKNDFLLIRSDTLKEFYLAELSTIILENTQISISSYLMDELIKRDIKVIFCDENHNPSGEVLPYYSSCINSKKIDIQIHWEENRKKLLKTLILKNKINNQFLILKKYKCENCNLLQQYINEMQFDDITNREGHSAKVYFNSLFGKDFTREENSNINSMLNYGYAIILSCFNREIVASGYLTQIGINHCNQYNEFNLSCDLMEPFRQIVDDFALNNKNIDFDKDMKHKIVDLLNNKRRYNGKEYFIIDLIRLYVNDCLNFLSLNNDYIPFNIYEL